MMRTRILLAVGVLALLPAVAGAWGSAPDPPPSDIVTLPPELGAVELWPYTGTSFDWTDPSDPVNLFFPNVDPRGIRQALMALPAERHPAPFDCVWTDAMGYEQTGWAATERWVGSEIQLACIHPGEPLGDPFRFHLRLFRQREHTVGAAHFEMLFPNTAEHQVLGWDFARQFVTGDLAATLIAFPLPVPTQPVPGHFRHVLRDVYDGLEADPTGAGAYLLGLLELSDEGLGPGDDVPIPTDFVILGLISDIVYQPAPEKTRTKFAAEYDVVAPKPFCNTGSDYVRLQGRLRFDLRVYGDEAGRFLRKYDVKGQLRVTPWNPITNTPLGHPSPARIREHHAAVLTDGYGQVYERASQELLGGQKQSLQWFLAAGEFDRYLANMQCGQ